MVIDIIKYRQIVETFRSQTRRPNFAAASRDLGIHVNTLKKAWLVGFVATKKRPDLPPIKDTIWTAPAGPGPAPGAELPSMRALVADLLNTSGPYVAALKGSAPAMEAHLKLLTATDPTKAAQIFGELSRAIARVTDSGERLHKLQKKIDWDAAAPQRERAAKAEEARIAALPVGHWERASLDWLKSLG